ncbi:hypothetical protein BD289DRAFT_434224 [Coniella lustricola]|uniref:Uncharacterized protein n=1 Tax=Coniella lustricola TaxID=2025994 RepID=A0A2T3A7T1_9PEZI|nr:hypothetical protein BD289DRAFT_434224 [Coniella lustricola]
MELTTSSPGCNYSSNSLTISCVKLRKSRDTSRLHKQRETILLIHHKRTGTYPTASFEMATLPEQPSKTECGLLLGGRFGTEGTNTPPAPGASLARTITLPDGFACVAPDDMYRINELAPGRREPKFSNLHNLSDEVIERTTMLSPIVNAEEQRRAEIWDNTGAAVKEALEGVPAGSHVNVCANR